VVGFLKKEFKVEGIMSGRLKPYSYVLRAGERTQGSQKLGETIFVVLESELRNDLLISCRDDAAIVFVLGDIDPDKVHRHGETPP
jgi:hypothetical protein